MISPWDVLGWMLVAMFGMILLFITLGVIAAAADAAKDRKDVH